MDWWYLPTPDCSNYLIISVQNPTKAKGSRVQPKLAKNCYNIPNQRCFKFCWLRWYTPSKKNVWFNIRNSENHSNTKWPRLVEVTSRWLPGTQWKYWLCASWQSAILCLVTHKKTARFTSFLGYGSWKLLPNSSTSRWPSKEKSPQLNHQFL